MFPDTVNLIRDQLYVDDGLGGAGSTELAKSTMNEMKTNFAILTNYFINSFRSRSGSARSGSSSRK